MAKSAKQKKIDELKKGLWEAICEQVQESVDDDIDCTGAYFDWDKVQDFLRGAADELVEVTGSGHKDYEGTLTVSAIDRKKILEEVESSCLSEKAKRSFRELLDA